MPAGLCLCPSDTALPAQRIEMSPARRFCRSWQTSKCSLSSDEWVVLVQAVTSNRRAVLILAVSPLVNHSTRLADWRFPI
jgi:hypothetical protein